MFFPSSNLAILAFTLIELIATRIGVKLFTSREYSQQKNFCLRLVFPDRLDDDFNSGTDSAEGIAEGIKIIVETIRKNNRKQKFFCWLYSLEVKSLTPIRVAISSIK